MKKNTILILILLMAAGLCLGILGCPADDSDDDDDDEDCDAEHVGGVYSVAITVTQDDCNPENIGDSEEGSLEIVQDGTDTEVEVWFTEFGPGSEREFLFAGTACGTQVIGSTVEDIPIEGKDCTGTITSNFTLTVNLTNSEVSGTFSGNNIWSGDECEEVGITPEEPCLWSKSVSPS